MRPFDWVMASILGLTGGISLLSFGVFIATGIDLWLKRTRMFRRWAFAVALLWFNIVVWGSVVKTIINW